jgi:hypothetical protein
MRSTLPLLLIGAWAAAAGAQTQTTVSAAAAPAALPGSVAAHKTRAAHPAERSPPRSAQARSATNVTKSKPPAAKGDGVLALGATDITGNKELPKVMVIVPWKSPSDAGGLIEPSDSVMNEVLGPVDRGVFQRRIRYYGQLNAAGEHTPAAAVAPVGDSR